DVLICFVLMMDSGGGLRGLYIEEMRFEKHHERTRDAWTCASRTIVMLPECCRDVSSWNLWNLEEVRRNFGASQATMFDVRWRQGLLIEHCPHSQTAMASNHRVGHLAHCCDEVSGTFGASIDGAARPDHHLLR
ncbi:hypothetical protein JI435_404290, partial [Parastagonospora nodorum SN15]